MATSDDREGLDDAFLAEYEAAVKRGEERRKKEPFAASVDFNPDRVEYFIRLETGQGFTVAVNAIPELRGASSDQLTNVDIFAQGDGIRWDSLDVDIATSTLLLRSLGWAVRREIGKKAGSAKSAKKAASAAENGKKGGRPRKKAEPVFKSAEPKR